MIRFYLTTKLATNLDLPYIFCYINFFWMVYTVSEDGLQRAVRGAGAGGWSQGQGRDRHGAGGRHAARGIRTQVPLRHCHGRCP